VLPHVDIYEVDSSGVQRNLLWRNVVRFDPSARYGGGRDGGDPFTYEDVLLTPALEALKSALNGRSNVNVEFSLAGEQGLSVFAFPKAWAAAMARLRAGTAGVGGGKHAFGFCFNWDKVCALSGWGVCLLLLFYGFSGWTGDVDGYIFSPSAALPPPQ
jgi:hypothetical protein